MSNNQSPEKGKASPTVTVACKLPHGLVLRLYDMEDNDEPIMGGGFKTVKRAVQRGDEQVVLNGYLVPDSADEDAREGRERVGGRLGYALTHGVDREFFEEWMKQNASIPAVKNHLIFAAARAADAKDAAKEKRGLRNGFEPIDPDKPPQVSRTLKVQRSKRPGERGYREDGDEAAA